MALHPSIRWFAVIFLICLSGGAIAQNLSLKERIVKLEPRVTEVERIVRVEQPGKKVTTTIVRKPVIKVVQRGVPGPRGVTGARGVQGRTGATGSRGPKGDRGEPGPRGAQGPIGKVIENTDPKAQKAIDKLQRRIDTLMDQLNKLVCKITNCPK